MLKVITFLFIALNSYVCNSSEIISEEITIRNGNIILPGTLSYTDQNSALVIWVHGSGNIDRNGNQKGTFVNANYIKQFRDEINKHKIAFFSFDKRTATESNLKIMQKKGALFTDFADDVSTIINHFKRTKRFSKIIVVGHSQGSLVGMLSLQKADKFISIAGAGETIDKTIFRQVSNQNEELGQLSQSYFKELKETGTIKEVNPFLANLFSKPNLPFLASWLKINPIEEVKKITIPTLIINGDKDLQVQITDAENLHKATPNAQLVIIKNMNHVLKYIEKEEDNMKSYMDPNYPLSKKLIETIVKFVNK